MYNRNMSNGQFLQCGLKQGHFQAKTGKCMFSFDKRLLDIDLEIGRTYRIFV